MTQKAYLKLQAFCIFFKYFVLNTADFYPNYNTGLTLRLFEARLISEQAVMVHSLGLSVDNGRDIYAKIDYVIRNKSSQSTICVSTVMGADTIRNLYKHPTGLIIKSADVELAAHRDVGSNKLTGVLDYDNGFYHHGQLGVYFPSDTNFRQKIIDCIHDRVPFGGKLYNEFLISKYKLNGIYLHDQLVGANDRLANSINNDTIADFYRKTSKYNLDYYYFNNGKFFRMKWQADGFVKSPNHKPPGDFYA